MAVERNNQGPAIKIEGLRKTLGKREVLKGIGFQVERGEIFGYLGPNGAGKTTTIRILLGLLEADAGKVEILGENLDSEAGRRRVGFLLELDGLYDNMTAWENLEFYARIYRVKEGRIGELLERVGLADRAHDMTGTFSKGMRQRLALARALVHDPDVLILDEPTSGVDPTGQIEVREILVGLAKEGRTVFLSSHNLDEIERICRSVALIAKGEIRLKGELESLRQKMGRAGLLVRTKEPLPGPILEELRREPRLGFREEKEGILAFTPSPRVESADVIEWLSHREVRIEEALREQSSLEELYSTFLKEAEPEKKK